VTPGKISAKVVADKLEVIERMRSGVSQLPLESEESFLSDPRNPAAGESYLRRMLEALMDLGRHILAKGFGTPATEYAAIADKLATAGVLGSEEAGLLRLMARYRNRMVHFYDEITPEEMYEILTARLADVDAVLDGIRGWMDDHPELVDETL